jgi:hypothetical protein
VGFLRLPKAVKLSPATCEPVLFVMEATLA